MKLLERRLTKMGLMSEWKAFAALSVDYFGMPVEALPLYASDRKWSRKVSRILSSALETSNFGHNRDKGYYEKYSVVVCTRRSLYGTIPGIASGICSSSRRCVQGVGATAAGRDCAGGGEGEVMGEA